MEEHSKIKNLINFLKENNVGLSSEEITNTYIGFISCNNNLNDFLTNKFVHSLPNLENEFKFKITKYISNHIKK